MEGGRKEAKKGRYLCFLLPLHSLEGPPFLHEKEVTLGSSTTGEKDER